MWMGYFYKQNVYRQTVGIPMTNEQKFLGYLTDLKGTKNQKLIECVQEGFKTLVEYQVVGNMTERGTDLMEGEGETPAGVPDEVVQLIEKLSEEIEELRGAMQSIDDIADKYDNEEYDEPEEFVSDDSELEAEESESVERAPVEEGVSDQGQSAADSEYEKSSSEVESGGTVYERDPNQVPDVDPRDIEPIEMGQRLGKVEGGNYRAPVNEYGTRPDQMEGGCGTRPDQMEGGCGTRPDQMENGDDNLPMNIRQGEAAGTDVEKDSEGAMANKQLNQIADQSERLAGSFEDKEELKAWVQAKITKAQQTIDSLYDYFNEEKGLDDTPAAEEPDEVTVDEQPIFEK